MRSRKGVFGMIEIIILLITLIALATLMPLINSTITEILPNVDSATSLIVRGMPFFLFLCVLISMLIYTKGAEEAHV